MTLTVCFQLFSIFFCTAYLLYKLYDRAKVNLTSREQHILLAGMFFFTVLIRATSVHQNQFDVDTSTWISSAITFFHYPDKLWTFLNYSDSRPLTVLPLIIGHYLGVPLNYVGSELIGLILWLGSIYGVFRILKLFTPVPITLLMVWSLCLFIGTAWPGYAVYNSEHSGILMLTMGLVAYTSYLFGKWRSPMLALLTGLLLGSVVFAKFQNVPMGMLIGLFLCYEMITKKDWQNLSFLLAGSVLPTAFIHIYYTLVSNPNVFWNNYFWNNYYYSYTTQFSSLPMGSRFSAHRILRFILLQSNTFYFLFTCSVVILFCVKFNFKSRISRSAQPVTMLLFACLFVIVSFYAVLQSGNNFPHYKLYLIVPFIFCTAVFMRSAPDSFYPYLGFVIVLGCLLQASYNTIQGKPMVLAGEKLDKKVSDAIRKHSQVTDPIVIWGWRDNLYIKSQRAMGYRDAHIFHFAMNSPLLPSWTADFIGDMDANRPSLFVDAMLPGYTSIPELAVSYTKIPAIHHYIRRHYQLIDDIEGIMIYKRR